MKRITLSLLLLALVGLVACSKNDSDAYIRPSEPPRDYFFSRVNYFTDGRTPYTDTLWTMRLQSQSMIDSFSVYNGRIVAQTNYYIQIDTMWSKAR